jgi:hypothetical protein
MNGLAYVVFGQWRTRNYGDAGLRSEATWVAYKSRCRMFLGKQFGYDMLASTACCAQEKEVHACMAE